MKNFFFTCGDINGIGPEISVKSFNKIKFTSSRNIIFTCPEKIFIQITELITPQFEHQFVKDEKDFKQGLLNVLSIPSGKLNIGTATKHSGYISFTSIKKSFEFVKKIQASALITAPISKTAFNLAGIKYNGHTDMLGAWCNTKNYIMTFLSQKMNAALSTIHIPLKKVSASVTKSKLQSQIFLLYEMLVNDIGISNPSIAILGLNPHAGEDGLIGDEEKKVIVPLVQRLKNKINIKGPFSPDAFFATSQYKKYDLVFGLYHDQVLIPFKMLNFAKGVNYTAGLPIIRTSPDHGVAYDIAWQNKADESSMLQSFFYADKILTNRMKNASAKKG